MLMGHHASALATVTVIIRQGQRMLWVINCCLMLTTFGSRSAG